MGCFEAVCAFAESICWSSVIVWMTDLREITHLFPLKVLHSRFIRSCASFIPGQMMMSPPHVVIFLFKKVQIFVDFPLLLFSPLYSPNWLFVIKYAKKISITALFQDFSLNCLLCISPPPVSRYKPFFPFQVQPPLGSACDLDFSVQDAKLVEGRLRVSLIECSR